MYLPILFRNWPPPLPTPTPATTKCVPSAQTVDIAEVIDTSTSMKDPTSSGGIPKLQAAIAAAKELVLLLKPADQASVVAFNSKSYLQVGLTSDRAALNAALASLPSTQAVGTRIDLGLDAAHQELIGPHHLSQNNRSIVLVTDGRQIGPPGSEAVTAAADRIKADGIKLITVGLGTDVDEDLLRSIASSPDLYFPAPNAEELLEIYRKIALVIPCP
jgi:Mg-chelatase subunit ChlD